MARRTPLYVALEGAEGCGKSTQASRLAARIDALLTRETGGTDIGARIREILHDTGVTDLAPRAEALLVAADRAQHLEQVVLPALAAGRHVVSDRSVYSALAYQGYGRGVDLDDLRRINGWAIRDRWPDVVVLLDADAAVLEHRLQGRDLDRFEREGDEFHARVRDGFRALAAAEPSRWAVVDAGAAPEAVAAAIWAAVAPRLDSSEGASAATGSHAGNGSASGGSGNGSTGETRGKSGSAVAGETRGGGSAVADAHGSSSANASGDESDGGAIGESGNESTSGASGGSGNESTGEKRGKSGSAVAGADGSSSVNASGDESDGGAIGGVAGPTAGGGGR